MNDTFSRLGIFVFYDPQGIVDDYVVHLLRSFRPHFRRMVVVSNCRLDQTGKKRLLQYSDDLLIRENQGLDAAAYKAGLISFCGWEEVEAYDEVVLMNDTFFGPIGSFEDMFAEMSRRDLDFWGMSAGYHSIDSWNRMEKGYFPDHIQTFFAAFRKNMVCTEAFRSYWESYDDTKNDFISVVTSHEVIMTKHFQDQGFRWEIYADTSRYCSERHSENFNIYHYHPLTIMRDMNFPVFKRKVLNVELPIHLCLQDLESAADAMAYIQNHSDYDTAMIWDNVLRIYNLSDLYQTMHLNYVLPSVQVSLPEKKRIALVYRVVNPFFAEDFFRHAVSLQQTADVYLIAEDEKATQILRPLTGDNPGITLLDGSGQKTEMGSFVLCCKELAMQYDYLGYIHDDVNPDASAATVMESNIYGYLQNVANDPAYLSQVINTFEQNPKLGVLGVPFPIHDYGFGNYSDPWKNSFRDIRSFAKQLGLDCNLSEDKPPFMLVGSFWCRTAAIRGLWNKNWSAKDFFLNPVTFSCKTNDALIRLLPYIAQSRRYYSGIVIHTNYASMRLTGQQFMLGQFLHAAKEQLGCTSPRYAGFMSQLQSLSRGQADPPLVVNLSKFDLKSIVQVYLNCNAPQWVTRNVHKLFRFFKNRKK